MKLDGSVIRSLVAESDVSTDQIEHDPEIAAQLKVFAAQPEPLSDSDRLAELMAVVSRALSTYREVGSALKEIRNSKLYRATHETFEAFIGEFWGMSRAHAYRLILAADVAELVSPNGDMSEPATESHCRELAKLPRESWPEAWGLILTRCGESPTAKQVASVVKQNTPPRREKEPPNIILICKRIGVVVEKCLEDPAASPEEIASYLRMLADRLSGGSE